VGLMARAPRKEGAGGTVSLITATLRGLPELDQEAGGCRAFGLVWEGTEHSYHPGELQSGGSFNSATFRILALKLKL